MKIIRQSFREHNDFADYQWSKYYRYSVENWLKIISIASNYPESEINDDTIFYDCGEEASMAFFMIELEDNIEV